MTVSRWFWQCFFLTAWGILLVIVGLLLIFEWPQPQRFGLWTDLFPHAWLPIGVCTLAVGEFLLAVVADDMAPGAKPGLVWTLQLTPWIVVLAVLVGVVV